MKPCDCNDLVTALKLNEQGIGFNKYRISIKPPNVIIEIEHTATLVLPQTMFRRFSEWYLEDQDGPNIT